MNKTPTLVELKRAIGKPHIHMISGSWRCDGLGCKSPLSKTPKIAYSHWRFLTAPRLRY